MSEIDQVVEQLKTAAEALSKFTPPTEIMPPDPAAMGEEQRRRWREFINVIAETQFSQRITSIKDSVDEIKSDLEDKVQDAVDRVKSDMGQWDELDPGEVQEAVDFVRNAPEVYDLQGLPSKVEKIEERLDNLKVRGEDVDVEELESDLEDLKTSLKPVLDMLKSIADKPVRAVS